ncbi:hypothetical protein ABK040_010394 [Willaertia magna]
MIKKQFTSSSMRRFISFSKNCQFRKFNSCCFNPVLYNTTIINNNSNQIRTYATKITRSTTKTKSSSTTNIDTLLSEYEERMKNYQPQQQMNKVTTTIKEETEQNLSTNNENNIEEESNNSRLLTSKKNKKKRQEEQEELKKEVDDGSDLPTLEEAIQLQESFKDRYTNDPIKILTEEEKRNLLTIDDCVQLLEENFVQDLLVMNLEGKCSFATHLIFATGSSYRHMKTLAKSILDEVIARKLFSLNPTIEGEQDSNWMIVDAGNIIVQVFSPEGRRYYDLERKWSFQTIEEYEPTLGQMLDNGENNKKGKKKKKK